VNPDVGLSAPDTLNQKGSTRSGST
jgi:hypothetical protein